MDGNVADVDTHIETWNMLRELSGDVPISPMSLTASYVHVNPWSTELISSKGGSSPSCLAIAAEDKWFRTAVKISEPPWECGRKPAASTATVRQPRMYGR